jgi:NTP pyrophosphatase (non-canonical NTP hydrolase)
MDPKIADQISKLVEDVAFSNADNHVGRLGGNRSILWQFLGRLSLIGPIFVHHKARSFQRRFQALCLECFGKTVTEDPVERNYRFLEEAGEVVQAGGLSEGEAHAIIRYVYSRPVGEIHQEVGGVLLCLSALATAHGLNMMEEAERELVRFENNMDKIREKQKTKPRFMSTTFDQ